MHDAAVKTTWKLSIKPASKAGSDPFEVCKDKSLLGLGWHHAFVDQHPSTREEARTLVEERWGKWPSQLNCLLNRVQRGDHVWIHQGGTYHLCKVSSDRVLFGREIHEDFAALDLGHAREADWREIPRPFVSGSVQRGTIARRTIQRIKISHEEWSANEFLFEKLRDDENWSPKVDQVRLAAIVARKSADALFKLMTPDEIEDFVAIYLQSRGWALIKSTCFGSNPKFEFMMVNPLGQTAHIQVKSGNSPNQLPPRDFQKWATDSSRVFLFSTHAARYPGPSVENVITLTHDDLYRWFSRNLWSAGLALQCRLLCLPDAEEEDEG